MKNYLHNMFSSIQNAQAVKKSFIFYPSTKFCVAFLNILWDEGFIIGYKTLVTNPKTLQIFLKYKNSKPAISSLRVVSKPGKKFYYSVKNLWKIDSTNGVLIISTNKGLFTLEECKKLNIGGEPLLFIK